MESSCRRSAGPGWAHSKFFGHATARGIPPIDDFGLAVDFEAASDGEHGVGARFRPVAPRLVESVSDDALLGNFH